MKIFHLLLIFILVSEYEMCENITDPSNARICNDRSGYGNYRCCFEQIILKNKDARTFCINLDKLDFENIKNYIKGRKEGRKKEFAFDDYSFDCSSEYFYISSLFLIIGLLLLN